jgi:tetratricopeptide (TPR) repeat protein
MRQHLFILLLIFVSVAAMGQNERKFIRKGNRYYKQAMENSDSARFDSINFVNAEVEYRKALEKKPNDFNAQFNIGNALFKQNKMYEAGTQFEQLIETAPTKEDKGKAWFNYGNSLLSQQKPDESIEAYKNALRNNPSDIEAKYNLEFARKMKQQQQQQQQNQDHNKDQDQQQDQDQDQDKQQDKKDQNQNKDKNQQNQDQQRQQQQPKISRQNAEQMLKALQNDEKETQEKVKKAKAAKAKQNRPDKDW